MDTNADAKKLTEMIDAFIINTMDADFINGGTVPPSMIITGGTNMCPDPQGGYTITYTQFVDEIDPTRKGPGRCTPKGQMTYTVRVTAQWEPYTD
jgi:hypothetical protein